MAIVPRTGLRNKLVIAVMLAAIALAPTTAVVQAQPGTSLDVVQLPGNTNCSVAGSFDGRFYITVDTCFGTIVQIYAPPAVPGPGPLPGVATLISLKPVQDSSGAPVTISVVDWDSSRNRVWAVGPSTAPGTTNNVYLIDLGDKTVSAPATATLQFTYNLPLEFQLVDGLAWDFTDDTVWISPDVSC